MAKIITIIGVRDGVGATTLAVNLACALQVRGNTLLVNLSHYHDLALALGQNGNIRSIGEVEGFLKRSNTSMVSGMLRVPQKKISLIENTEGLASGVQAFCLSELSKMYDNMVIDAGSNFSASLVDAVKMSSSAVLVSSSDINVLCQAENVVKKISRSFYPLGALKLVCNDWDESSLIPRSCVAERVGINCDLFLNRSAVVKMTSRCGRPIIMDSPHNDYSLGVNSLADSFLNGPDIGGEFVHVDWDSMIEERTVFKGTPATTNNRDVKCSDSILPPEACGVKKEILEKLLDAMDIKDLRESPAARDGKSLYAKAETVVLEMINGLDENKLTGIDRKLLVKEVLDEALGLGPLEGLIADDGISEIMVNSKDRIYVERAGKIFETSCRFTSDRELMRVIERIVAPIGRRIDESSPMVDARLIDGSRVNIVIPPLALKGPSITIRKFSQRALEIKDLIDRGTLTESMANFLKGCVKGRLNIIVSGGTGSGKTTLLNVLSSFIPEDERIVTIEDAAELQLSQEHVVKLESRPPNIEGKGAVTIRDLVKNALRMRPDRIVVGECRGGEALDMLQAMNTGHDGSLTTIHSNSPRDSMSRLETLVMFAGIELPAKAIREQVSSAIDLVVQLSRQPDGSRKIVQITEVSGMEGDKITMQDLFIYGRNSEFISTGFRPRFLEDLKAKGVEL